MCIRDSYHCPSCATESSDWPSVHLVHAPRVRHSRAGAAVNNEPELQWGSTRRCVNGSLSEVALVVTRTGTPAGLVSMRAAASVVEQAEQAYGTHIVKEGEPAVPPEVLAKFLKVQNGSDIRGVVLDGALPSAPLPRGRCICDSTLAPLKFGKL